MKKIWEFVKRKYHKYGKRVGTYLGALLVLLVVYYLFRIVLAGNPDLAGLPYSLTKAFFGVVTLKLVDDLLLNEIPTCKRLKNEPIGYAIYVHGYALVVALSFL